MLNDLLLNLISEAVGIIVTVFIVDRLIQRREDRRWRPVKNMVYIKLLNTIDKIIDNYAFSNTRIYPESNTVMYFYGDASVISFRQYKSFDSFELEKQIKLDAKILHLDGKNFDIAPIKLFKEEMDTLFSTSGQLLDAEVRLALLKLEQKYALLNDVLMDLKVMDFPL